MTLGNIKPTDDKRIRDLEKASSEFYMKLFDFEKKLSQFSTIADDIKRLKESSEAHYDDLLKALGKTDRQVSTNISNIDRIASDKSSLHNAEDIIKLKSTCKDQSVELEKLRLNIAALTNTVIDLSTNTQKRLDGLQKNITDSNHEISILNSKISALTLSSDSHKANIEIASNACSKNQANLNEVTQALDEIRKTLKSLKQSFQDDLHQNSKSIKESLEQYVSNKFADLPNVHEIITEFNNDFLNEVESHSLDLRNALIRCQNLESSFNIIEKKMENLSLTVKKIQLSHEPSGKN